MRLPWPAARITTDTGGSAAGGVELRAARGLAAARLRALGTFPLVRFIRGATLAFPVPASQGDRKSTRLNSSHVKNSYAVFCLKKKTIGHTTRQGEPVMG